MSATGRRRAVVFVGGPAAPYSRGLRIARALAAEGFDVEIAAVASAGLPEREDVTGPAPGSTGVPEPAPEAIGRIELRRYGSSGLVGRIGASRAATGARAGSGGGPPRAGGLRGVARRVAWPVLAVRRWLLWPHAVRGWWSTLARDLAPADLYHACGALAIEPALAARDRAAARRPVVVYDAIDDVAASNETSAMPGPIRRRIARRETAWARRADLRLTVNEALADVLAARWGTTRPLVVPNYPDASGVDPTAVPGAGLREAAGLPAGTRIVLFQGRIGPDLGLETAAEAILAVPDAALVVLGFGRGLDASRARDRDPRFTGRHVTLDARSPDELLAWTRAADVALIPLPPVSDNQRRSTPNKLWEALAVGTPVVVGSGLTVMAELVRAHDLGVVAATSAAPDLAAAIRTALDRLDTEGDVWRARIAAVARERFAWPAAASAYRAAVREARR